VAYSRLLIQRYPSVEQFLENEQDVITSGQYNPNVADPEHSNPLATSGWELALLRFHYHAGVARQATEASNAKILQLPGEEPDTLRARRLREEEDLLIAFVRNAKKHPLDPSNQAKKSGDGKRQRIRARFVTPRHADCVYIDGGQA
jgi:CBF/Mak21 family